MESWRDICTFTGADGVVVVATMRYEQYTVWSRLRLRSSWVHLTPYKVAIQTLVFGEITVRVPR